MYVASSLFISIEPEMVQLLQLARRGMWEWESVNNAETRGDGLGQKDVFNVRIQLTSLFAGTIPSTGPSLWRTPEKPTNTERQQGKIEPGTLPQRST